MNHVVIMAGGSGTRFWPLSRRATPKQLLPLWNGRPLIAHTVERFESFLPREHLFVVTGSHLKRAIMEAVPELLESNIIVEPAQRNTAPCVGLAAAVIGGQDPDAVMGFFPADAYIGRRVEYLEVCRLGFEAAGQGKIATVGIRPTRPETGYGYIRSKSGGGRVLEVDSFVEKPDAITAEMYVRDGRYLWNAGIFFLSRGKLQQEIDRQLPRLGRAMNAIEQALNSGDTERVEAIFEALESISIDYGVMEHARDVVVIPADFEWNDVGYWASLGEVLPSDERGNLCIGKVCALHTQECVLINHGGGPKVLAVVGVSGLVVVDTPDATLVLPKDQSQRVREVVAWLKSHSRHDLL